MLKVLKIFSAFILLHTFAWVGTHYYLSENKKEVLVVVDTSYAMKKQFSDVKKWISDFESSHRYTTLIIGTDKAKLGHLSSLNSIESIFRTSFGRIQKESLNRYSSFAGDKYFLSDGSITLDGWKTIEFHQ